MRSSRDCDMTLWHRARRDSFLSKPLNEPRQDIPRILFLQREERGRALPQSPAEPLLRGRLVPRGSAR